LFGKDLLHGCNNYSLTKINIYSFKKLRGIAIPTEINYIFHKKKKPLIILYFLPIFKTKNKKQTLTLAGQPPIRAVGQPHKKTWVVCGGPPRRVGCGATTHRPFGGGIGHP